MLNRIVAKNHVLLYLIEILIDIISHCLNCITVSISIYQLDTSFSIHQNSQQRSDVGLQSLLAGSSGVRNFQNARGGARSGTGYAIRNAGRG